MYSSVDSISNHTKPQFISNLTRLDGYACSHLLGKRCTTLNHDIFCSSIKHVDGNTSHLKKQKLAMHVNTRHMGLHHPSAGMLYHQDGVLAPVQDLVNKPFSFQEPQPQPSIGRKQSKSTAETSSISKKFNISTQNAIGNSCSGDAITANVQSTNKFAFDQNNPIICPNTNTSTPYNDNTVTYISDGQISANNNASSKTKPTFHERQQKQSIPCNIFLPKVPKKPFIVPSKRVSPTFHPYDHVAASNNQTTVGHTNTRGVAPEFLGSVHRWRNAIQHVCDARKQQEDYELFGDEPTCTADASDLLKVLKHINQKKNQITHEEEHATGLIEAISTVLETCDSDNPTDKESIMLAGKILDNLFQRFRGVHFHGGTV